MLERLSKGIVYDVLFTKSKTVILFPTGLKIDVPSGLKTTFPHL